MHINTDANQGEGFLSGAWQWLKTHFYTSADYQLSIGPQFDLGLKNGYQLTVVPFAQILAEGHVDNHGSAYNYNGFNNTLGSMDGRFKSEYGGAFDVGVDFLSEDGQKTLSIGALGFLGGSISWDDTGISHWNVGIDISLHGAVFIGGSGEVKFGLGN